MQRVSRFVIRFQVGQTSTMRADVMVAWDVIRELAATLPRAIEGFGESGVVVPPFGSLEQPKSRCWRRELCARCGLIRTRDLLGLRTDIVGVVSDRANSYRLSFEAGRVGADQLCIHLRGRSSCSYA